MPPKPKSKCCRSAIQCRRCPLRAPVDEPAPTDHLPALFHDVLRADRRSLPDCVTDALGSLAEARAAATAPAEAG